MAEGDTIWRAARRIEAAMGGQELAVEPRSGPARAAGLGRIDGRRLERVEARGKHLLLHFDDFALHSHLGMSGSWHVYSPGARWQKPEAAAWVTLGGTEVEAVQFGGPTLRLLSANQLRMDPTLSRLGPDVLAARFDPETVRVRLQASPERELGDALLDQRLVAGIGNIFKSEACFMARVSPWRKVGELEDTELESVLEAGRQLMREAVESGRPNAPSTTAPVNPVPSAARSSSLAARATPTAAPTGAPLARGDAIQHRGGACAHAQSGTRPPCCPGSSNAPRGVSLGGWC